MISIGLTTWSDHPDLSDKKQTKISLSEYAEHFPTVEIDTTFYGIPTLKTIKNWQSQVPKSFQFCLKANKLMTLHDLRSSNEATKQERNDSFQRYKASVEPLVASNQLKTILFQFPPYFRRNNENIKYLKIVREKMGSLPISIEFRHPSWLTPDIRDSVAEYLSSLKMTLAIIDEPHSLNNGVPFVPIVTNKQLALIRLHGRNEKGWFNQGPQWRKTRTLYNYSVEELKQLAKAVINLQKIADNVCIIFNNNGGHDAAKNALTLEKLLGNEVKAGQLNPHQLDLLT